MLALRAILIFIFMGLAPTAAGAQPWAIGQEREVDEGFYVRLVTQQNGWRHWRIETRNEVSCQAIKSAEGRPHPIPLGVSAAFYRGTPFLTLSEISGRLSFGWQGANVLGERLKYRAIGERFWTDWVHDGDLMPFANSRLEVNIVTYQYPRIFAGRIEETAVINLTGLEEAARYVLNCEQG
jgi:hypothetical protein